MAREEDIRAMILQETRFVNNVVCILAKELLSNSGRDKINKSLLEERERFLSEVKRDRCSPIVEEYVLNSIGKFYSPEETISDSDYRTKVEKFFNYPEVLDKVRELFPNSEFINLKDSESLTEKYKDFKDYDYPKEYDTAILIELNDANSRNVIIYFSTEQTKKINIQINKSYTLSAMAELEKIEGNDIDIPKIIIEVLDIVSSSEKLKHYNYESYYIEQTSKCVLL